MKLQKCKFGYHRAEYCLWGGSVRGGGMYAWSGRMRPQGYVRITMPWFACSITLQGYVGILLPQNLGPNIPYTAGNPSCATRHIKIVKSENFLRAPKALHTGCVWKKSGSIATGFLLWSRLSSKVRLSITVPSPERFWYPRATSNFFSSYYSTYFTGEEFWLVLAATVRGWRVVF